MPPNERPIPRFIADTTQEGIPHGRFAERRGDTAGIAIRQSWRTFLRVITDVEMRVIVRQFALLVPNDRFLVWFVGVVDTAFEQHKLAIALARNLD